jgi:hypothetical protein
MKLSNWKNENPPSNLKQYSKQNLLFTKIDWLLKIKLVHLFYLQFSNRCFFNDYFLLFYFKSNYKCSIYLFCYWKKETNNFECIIIITSFSPNITNFFHLNSNGRNLLSILWQISGDWSIHSESYCKKKTILSNFSYCCEFV